MKTRCPACQTVFRVAPEQLKVRAGKVRCGECQEIFNALDFLIDDGGQLAPPSETALPQASLVGETNGDLPSSPEIDTTFGSVAGNNPAEDRQSDTVVSEALRTGQALETVPAADDEGGISDGEETSEKIESETGVRPVPVDDLILPRETSQIAGYSKWAEGVMSSPVLPVAAVRTPRWPFIAAAVSLLLLLAGQLVFHFRSEVVIAAPSLRPALEKFAGLFDAGIPLPRHVELISIEASDLQSDPVHGNALVLSATLRNRAGYPQEFPALELSLTDTQDAAIARKVFLPDDYLPAEARGKPFAANADIAIRLWIEAKEISAAGYRLYVFYP